ncbi:2-oxoglutarate and iron-dependent oxygenase domain-containing protein, partial [Mesorhizobium sp. MSK_1335]
EEHERLRMTCEKYGFFYLVEHGIPKEQISEAIQASRRFFALPAQRENAPIVAPTPIRKQRCTHV